MGLLLLTSNLQPAPSRIENHIHFVEIQLKSTLIWSCFELYHLPYLILNQYKLVQGAIKRKVTIHTIYMNIYSVRSDLLLLLSLFFGLEDCWVPLHLLSGGKSWSQIVWPANCKMEENQNFEIQGGWTSSLHLTGKQGNWLNFFASNTKRSRSSAMVLGGLDFDGH